MFFTLIHTVDKKKCYTFCKYFIILLKKIIIVEFITIVY